MIVIFKCQKGTNLVAQDGEGEDLNFPHISINLVNHKMKEKNIQLKFSTVYPSSKELHNTSLQPKSFLSLQHN